MDERLRSEHGGGEGGKQSSGERGETHCAGLKVGMTEKHGKTEREVQADRPTQIID